MAVVSRPAAAGVGQTRRTHFQGEKGPTELSNVPRRFGVKGDADMTNAFVEPRPKGKPDGSAISDFVVEDRADHVLATFKTQEEAIHWARTHGFMTHVARVRHLNDKKKPDQWRRV